MEMKCTVRAETCPRPWRRGPTAVFRQLPQNRTLLAGLPPLLEREEREKREEREEEKGSRSGTRIPAHQPEPWWEPVWAVPKLPEACRLAEGLWGATTPGVAFPGLCPPTRQTRMECGAPGNLAEELGGLSGFHSLPTPHPSGSVLQGAQEC